MHPILFHIGGFAVHGYGLMSAIGFLVVVFISVRRARAIGVKTDHLVDVVFWSAVAGVIGARGLWVLQNRYLAPTFYDWINVREGGLVFYGAILLGVPAALGVMRWRKLPMLKLADVFATALPFGHALARVGCFLAGCCYGTETDLPWAVKFKSELADAPYGVPIHPTQLYEAGGLLLIGVITSVLYSRKKFDGQVLLTYLGLYAIIRIPIETVRGDLSRGFVFESLLGQTVSTSQAVSVVMLALIAALWRQLGKRAA